MTPEQRAAALLHKLDSICNALQYDPSGQWGVETIGPIREAIALLLELAAEPLTNEQPYTITWDAQGRRLVNGKLVPEEKK